MVDALFLQNSKGITNKIPNQRIRQRESKRKSLSFYHTVEIKQPHSMTEPFSLKSGFKAGKGEEGRKKACRYRLLRENREARRRSGSLPDSEDMTLQGELVGELLADESENRAKKHESGANEDNLQSEIHKNSLSFFREGRSVPPRRG